MIIDTRLIHRVVNCFEQVSAAMFPASRFIIVIVVQVSETIVDLRRPGGRTLEWRDTGRLVLREARGYRRRWILQLITKHIGNGPRPAVNMALHKAEQLWCPHI